MSGKATIVLSTIAATAIVLTGVSLILGKAAHIPAKPAAQAPADPPGPPHRGTANASVALDSAALTAPRRSRGVGRTVTP
jgi:hypothetical protein